MKYKKLSKEQILISLDRLTRFKPTKEKYLRVFYDIILSNLIEPSLKKSELSLIPIYQIRDYAQEIFNNSLENTCNNYDLNQKLKNYENSVFINDEDTQILLDNQLDYKSALKHAKKLEEICDQSPVLNYSIAHLACKVGIR